MIQTSELDLDRCECGGQVVADGWCQGCINHFDGYHQARLDMHARYMRLVDQAWSSLQRLRAAKDTEYKAHTPFITPRWDRLFRTIDRAERRYRRRAKWVRALGMDEESVQQLDTDERVLWRGQTLIVADWHCHRDPVHGPTGRRIWAEPVFHNERGQTVGVLASEWHELVRANW